MNIFDNPVLANMLFDQGLDAFIDVAKKWNGFETFIPNLETFKTQFMSRALKTYTANRSDFGYNVLNHADFHLKNLLFKKTAGGAVEDFYFVSNCCWHTRTIHLRFHTFQIDYQISIYATPAIDLIYALYYFVSSVNRQQHRDELIAIYHQQFVESLKKFGYLKPPPSLIDLKVELLRNGNLEVLVAICLSIFFYFDFTQMSAEDMDMGEGTKKAKRRMYREGAGFKDVILKELSGFLFNGFIWSSSFTLWKSFFLSDAALNFIKSVQQPMNFCTNSASFMFMIINANQLNMKAFIAICLLVSKNGFNCKFLSH